MARTLVQLFLFSNTLNIATYAGAVASCKCIELASSIQIQNASLVVAEHHPKDDTIELTGLVSSCSTRYSIANATADLCRVVFTVHTTNESEVLVEGWLPDTWNQRLLASGGGGIGGCVDYGTVQFGAQFGFASFGTNSGHNGSTGYDFFLNKPEVLEDFGHRAIHVEAVIAKEIVQQYYGKAAAYNYYSGCSTGGRQAIASALWYPEDFDGVLAGSPGINWLRIVAERGILARRIGWPNVASPQYIRADQWIAIVEVQTRLIDPLDGVTDGIIDDPTQFRFQPEKFRCGTNVLNASLCLTNEQIANARAAYEPLADSSGRIVFPAFDIGAPTSAWSRNIMNGTPSLAETILQDFWRGAVHNDTTWNATAFTTADMDLATSIDPGRINTWDPDLSAYYNRGGKILSWHGRQDNSVTSQLSIEYFDWVQSTLNISTPSMQSFYRLFFVPGLYHCTGGPGSWYMGQPLTPNVDIEPQYNSSLYNMLLALVEWTENGVAPLSMIGTKFEDDRVDGLVLSQRRHCAYPSVSRWDGRGDTTKASSWVCENLV